MGGHKYKVTITFVRLDYHKCNNQLGVLNFGETLDLKKTQIKNKLLQ